MFDMLKSATVLRTNVVANYGQHKGHARKMRLTMFKRLALMPVFILLAGAVLSLSTPKASAAPILPNGFEDTLVASVASPTAIAFTPDSRLLVTTQQGVVYVVRDGTLQMT